MGQQPGEGGRGPGLRHRHERDGRGPEAEARQAAPGPHRGWRGGGRGLVKNEWGRRRLILFIVVILIVKFLLII